MIFYLTALIQGFALAMGLGIFITMKIFRIPDITTDGSYTLGAAVTAYCSDAGLVAARCRVTILAAGRWRA